MTSPNRPPTPYARSYTMRNVFEVPPPPLPALARRAPDPMTRPMAPLTGEFVVKSETPLSHREQSIAREFALRARDDVAEIMERIGATFHYPVNRGLARAPVMRELPTELDLKAWASDEVDKIEAKIRGERGPYIPLLNFLDSVTADEPPDEPEPETAALVPPRPSPRPRGNSKGSA